MSSRLDQLEAAMIDTEMAAMLKAKLAEVFSVMKPGMIFQYEPELDAFVEFLIWRFSIWVDKPTPGNALMNLRYRDECGADFRRKLTAGVDGPGLKVTQKLWYYIATVGAHYFWVRAQFLFTYRTWGDLEQRSLLRRTWFCLQCIVGIYKAMSLGNLLVFLYSGKYRNLIERVLRLRLVYGNSDMNFCGSNEKFDFISDWTEDMQLHLLPLLDSPTIRNLFFSFSKGQNTESNGKQTLCPICGSNPTIAFFALPCQHRYCYYCLQTRCSAVPSFRCVECREPVIAMQRYTASTGATTSTTCTSLKRESLESQLW